MKRLLIILLTFVYFDGVAQSDKNDYKRLIDSAITIQGNQLHELSQKNGSNNQALLENLYLINEENFPYENLSAFSKIQFKLINISTDKSKKLLKRDGIHAWKVSGVLKGNRMTVNIISFYIAYKKNTYNFSNGGGSETVFEYQCDEKRWILLKSVASGI